MKKTGHIDPEALKQLKKHVGVYFDFAYYDGRYPEFKGEGIERVVESGENIEKILDPDCLELRDIYFFIYKELRSIASSFPSPGKFTELLKPEEIADHRDKIIDKLLSYPKEYQVFIPLPNVALPLKESLIISDRASIVRTDESLTSSLPSIKSPLSTLPPIRLHEDLVCLTFCIEGFLGIPMSTSQEKVKSEYKKLVASLLVSNFLEKGSNVGIVSVGMPLPGRAYIYCLYEDNEALTFELSLQEAKIVQELYFRTLTGHALKDLIGVTNLSTLFHSNPHLKKDERSQIERVRTSLEWYFEGLVNENETFSFILFCTAIEALLGFEKGTAGITVGLSDRISFLIAKDVMEREAIKKNFLKAYNLRSEIIHRGQINLSRTERESLSFLRYALEEAVRKEMQLLPK